MPTYGYECKSCGYTFDVFQSMKDDPLKECPQCGKEIRRLINGGSGVIFKGSGFYVTDKGKTGAGPAKDAGKAGPPAKTAEAAPAGEGKAAAAPAGSGSGGESGAAAKPGGTGPAPAAKKASGE
jgi:putative FmdB family regulatory protein